MIHKDIQELTGDILSIIKKAIKTMNESEVEALISYWNSSESIGSIERSNNFDHGYSKLRKAIYNKIKEENPEEED